ncbi:MAG: hypothetical protein KBS91_03155 [Firmicutes bacterium]|nr:hypothetical protein [Candidatus Caballimonas caccae]
MTKEENFHAGHRARMTDKILCNPDSLQDHELLEAILFSFLPRIDTNLLAHRLLRTFGTLPVLFNAKPEDIMATPGIGKKTASKILLMGQLLKRTINTKPLPRKPFRSLRDFESYAVSLFTSLTRERFVLILLDIKHFPITTLIFDDESVDSVTVRIDEIVHAFAIHKPTYVILAHNHPSGFVEPSGDDDITTAKFYMICKLHGITLNDHAIISENKVFSYRMNDKMIDYEDKYRLEDLLENSEEQNVKS